MRVKCLFNSIRTDNMVRVGGLKAKIRRNSIELNKTLLDMRERVLEENMILVELDTTSRGSGFFRCVTG